MIRVELPGQPPSANHQYAPVRGQFGKLAKKSDVASYQADVTGFVRRAMPPRWQAGRRVVIRFWFYLGRPVDATNAMKVIEDAIGEALCPGLNPPTCCRRFDDRFLCQAIELETGFKEPSVVVEIE